jgi:predicted phosphodiesterase
MIALMRVLVISDVHANLVALETVLADAAGKFDVVWCLGDVVGYGPRPNECVDLVRSRAALCVIGNHDWAALDRPGINVDDFNPNARHAVLWTQEQLTSASRDYLNGLADRPQRPLDSVSLVATHASPREPVWEYILTPSIAMENFFAFADELCLVGHTHKPAIFEWAAVRSAQATETSEELIEATDADASDEGPWLATVSLLQPVAGMTVRLPVSAHRRLILNPGSVGQPRDNDARAAYAILDLERRAWRQERVAYPVELTQSQMRSAHLPRRLIDRLSFGW